MREIDFRTARLMKALGNPVRYLLIEELLAGPKSVGQLAEELNKEIATISQHLRVLRTLDLVRYETLGKQVFYRVKHPTLRRFMEEARRCGRFLPRV